MKVIAHYSSYEKDVGWMHEIEVETDQGHLVTVIDDTDEVTILSNSPDTAITEAAAIWSHYRMGTSGWEYDAPSGERTRRSEHRVNYHDHLIYDGSGVDLSHIDNPRA